MTAPATTFPGTVVRWWIALAAIAGLAVGLVAWPILGGGRLPAGIVNEPLAAPHTVTVTGTGRVPVAPDMAEVRLGVLIQRPTVAAAREAAASATNAVVAALREAGIPEADIQTSTLTLQPVYEYPTVGTTTPRIVAYEIRNGLTVTVRDMDRVGPAIDQAIGAGATTLDSLALQVADPATAERQARRKAVLDARSRADTLVDAAGARIDDIVSVTESVTTPP